MGGSNETTTTEFKKGLWSREEDQKMLAFIQEHGHGNWRNLPSKAGLQRCGKSCRLRWTNYLRPDIKRGKFTAHEEKTIIRLHALLGNSWSSIAAHLPKRTDNEIKNYWNTRLKKRLIRMGIDPVTHKPKNNLAAGSRNAAALSHMAQWEASRLQAEARLAHAVKLPLPRNYKPPPPPPPPPLLAVSPCLDVLNVWESTSIPSSFFMVSPTSTLNFSCNTTSLTAVPTFNPIVSNEYACGIDSHTEAVNDDHVVHPSSNDCEGAGQLDLSSFNQDSDGYNVGCPLVGELEDNENYWNDLLNLVSSPMMELQSPALLWG